MRLPPLDLKAPLPTPPPYFTFAAASTAIPHGQQPPKQAPVRPFCRSCATSSSTAPYTSIIEASGSSYCCRQNIASITAATAIMVAARWLDSQTLDTLHIEQPKYHHQPQPLLPFSLYKQQKHITTTTIFLAPPPPASASHEHYLNPR